MSIWLDDFNQHLMVAGFSDVRIKNIKQFFQIVKNKTDGACVQFLDASLIAGLEHLRFAALNALSAFKGKVNISSGVTMEILLYASAQRQIKEAVKMIGVKPNTTHVAVVVLAKNQKCALEVLKAVSGLLGGRRDDSIIKLTDSKTANLKRLFNISEAELYAKTEQGTEKEVLTELIIEHMALLVTQR